MSRTREYIESTYGAETAASNIHFEVLVDGDGDFWLGRKRPSSVPEYIMVLGSLEEEFAEVLSDAGALPEEYTPDDDEGATAPECSGAQPPHDPSPSPEDVADEWVRLTDAGGGTVYMPNDDRLEVENDPGRTSSTLKFSTPGEYVFRGELKNGGREWVTSEYERIPASEVPIDE